MSWKIVGAVALGFATLLGISTAARLGGEAPAPAATAATAATAAAVRTSPTVVSTAETSAETGAESPVAEAPIAPRPLEKGKLRPGSYVATRFDPGFTFSVGDGWRTLGDRPEFVALALGEGRDLTVMRAPLYVADPETSAPAPAPLDMIEWVRSHPCVEKATRPVPVRIGGNSGTQLDFAVSSDPSCAHAYWEQGGGMVFGFEAGEQDRLIALSVNAGGSLHELLVDVSTVDPRRFAAFAKKAATVLDTVAFR